MAKCDCWVEKGPYCNGTREQDICSCNGDRRKCDFYEDVREKAILAAAQKYNSDPVKATTHFQWNSMDTAPTDFTDEHLYILVCYIENGDARYNAYECLTKNILENSFVGKHAIAWCYIKPPDHVLKKKEAIKRLRSAGVLDKDGNIAPFYESILAKVDDL